MADIVYTVATTDAELYGILSLQRNNLAASLTPEEAAEHGFVTVEHDFALLKRMNAPYPHVIAKDGNSVVGYTLVMMPELRNEIAVLRPMFDQFDQITYHGLRIRDLQYVVMGQVCISKGYRGAGIFQGLYREMQHRLSHDFDVILTEVSKRNTRSLRAHQKAGFEFIHTYTDVTGEEWVIVLLKIRDVFLHAQHAQQ